MSTVSPLPSGSVTSPAGFRAGIASAGFESDDRPDVAVLVSDTPCSGAGVFTANRVRAAPVLYDQGLLLERPGRLRGIVMNAGFANACTGESGVRSTERMTAMLEREAGLPGRSVLALSTGIIGVPIPIDDAERAVAEAAGALQRDNGVGVARAIMTTDRQPKHVGVELETSAGVVTIGGIAKGSSMIHPNMATLLGVITTDARVDPAQLGAALHTVADRTFNAITVDGNSSPNDTVLILANGASGVELNRDAAATQSFQAAVEHVARELALMVVRDGEGATRFIELTVTGATSESMARAVGRHIGSSAVVKVGLAGGEPDWGRILAAAGSSGFPLEPDRMGLAAQVRDADGGPDGDWVIVAEGGATAEPDLNRLATIFSAPEIALRLDLGLGGASARIWTCDLSTEYLHANAGKLR